MKRLFPAPWLSLALLGLWLVLNLSMSPGNLLLGALLGVLAPLMMAPLRPQPISLRRPGVILSLFLRVGRDVIVSNLQVAWGVLTCGSRPPRARFIKIPIDLRSPNGLAALSMITTVVPGTIWSELALDRSVLLLHVFDLDDEAQFIEHFKSAYERPLMEIFE
ncbi:Multiple resistance and pH homeostasis protein E [Pseudomonas sp. 24 E 13]|jgi:multicomponent K+:H+ antiporter subunit E|uniref:Na+/H+ antiporter subunit E n=1 Tax=Pseudomonas orientalis TaxID=76758 RepID=A0A4Q7D2U8_9PSED|nr:MULTISPECIES: Na+/H+ antiporter subunit E [Pseudomonas]POM10496.1 Na+/H+ antiporter subunit E [Pseudomonas sp. WP001]RZI32481.1 Na+/H+ antiporter subunit E [Pseudomonas orientalis]CRM67831.1 Multiple resistance and pH homeostasis protein E [Pseudomonas sp. 24 E 13]CRM69881.1 Multiple resistance and pH homeostasis protein E [Pseudomonas sp. 44 R 15]CRN01462.1 Multiple resistance and pH homeostasis protein E [Pseudomonas sp. 34 E 7]